jgi:hypothetical protein
LSHITVSIISIVFILEIVVLVITGIVHQEVLVVGHCEGGGYEKCEVWGCR